MHEVDLRKRTAEVSSASERTRMQDRRDLTGHQGRETWNPVKQKVKQEKKMKSSQADGVAWNGKGM